MPLVARRHSEPPNGRLPSAVLLPSDGARASVRPWVPDRALAAEALRILRRLDHPARVPADWRKSGFAREVGLVRAHLAPIRSRSGLAASYSREAFHASSATSEPNEPPGAVRVTYAIRWLELRAGIALPAWPSGPEPAERAV